MKSKILFPMTIAALMFVLQPAWAGPYSSKSQNAPSADSSCAAKCETKAKCYNKTAKCAKPGAAMADGRCQRGDHHGMGMGREHMKHFMENMSAEDRAHFKNIHEKLSKNPDVQAAREAMKNADSREAKHAAFKKLHDVKRAAMSDEDRAFMDGLRAKMKAKRDGGQCHG